MKYYIFFLAFILISLNLRSQDITVNSLPENSMTYTDFETGEIFYCENNKFYYSNGITEFIELKTVKKTPGNKTEMEVNGTILHCTFPDDESIYKINLRSTVMMGHVSLISKGPDNKEQDFISVGNIKEPKFEKLLKVYYQGTYSVIQTMKNNVVMDNSKERIKLEIKNDIFKMSYDSGKGVWIPMSISSGSFFSRNIKVKIDGNPAIFDLKFTFYEAGAPCLKITNPDKSEQYFATF